MLRHLGKNRDDGTPYLRKGDKDTDDSVFLVLLGEEVGPLPDGNATTTWMIASAWTSLGEAQGALNRYVNEGHKAHHGWTIVRLMEVQTGQLAPDMERYGDDEKPRFIVSATAGEAERIAELELEIQQLRAKLGNAQVSGQL